MGPAAASRHPLRRRAAAGPPTGPRTALTGDSSRAAGRSGSPTPRPPGARTLPGRDRRRPCGRSPGCGGAAGRHGPGPHSARRTTARWPPAEPRRRGGPTERGVLSAGGRDRRPPRAPRTGGKPPGNTQTSGVTAADRARVETWEGDSRTSARAPRCRGRDTERSHPGVRAPALPRLLGLSRCALRPTTSCALTGCSHAAPQSANRDDGGAGPAAGWQGDRRQRPRVGVSARGHRRRPFLPGRDGDAGLARSTPDRGQLGSPRRSEEADGTEGNKRFGTTNGHEDWCSVFKWPKAAAASSEPAKLQTFVSRSSLLQLPGQPPRRPRAPVALGDSCCPRRGRPSGPSGSTALRAHAVSLAMQVMAGDRRSQALAGVARAGDGCPVCKAFFPVCRESPALPPHRVESRRPTGPGEGRGAAP